MANQPTVETLPWSDLAGGKIRVAIVGDIILDEYIDGAVNRISPEAPVPVHLVASEYVTCGGAGNVALNIKQAGGEPLLFGVCGNDDAGQKLVNSLNSHKIGTDFIIVSNERPTTRKTRVRSGQQQLLRIDWERTCPIDAEVQKNILQKVRATDFDALLISDYGKGGLSDNMISELVKIADEKQVPSIVDPKGRDFSRYRGVSLITPNRKEALEAIGEDPLSEIPREQIAATLQKKWGLKNVLVTLGGEGMLLWREGETEKGIHLPTVAREVFDVSGAGDTVVAMISLSLAAKASFEQSLRIANYAAGIVVQKWGTQPILLHELQAAIQNTKNANALGTIKKIHERSSAVKQIESWKKEGKKIVFTNGCFDILHGGHIDYLEKTKALGDALVVGLNSDKSVASIKGKNRPIIDEKNRARLVAALGFVDLVVVFSEDTPQKLIEELSPSLLVKGADWKVDEIAGSDFVLKNGGEVQTIELVPGLSTTNIINKILETS